MVWSSKQGSWSSNKLSKTHIRTFLIMSRVVWTHRDKLVVINCSRMVVAICGHDWYRDLWIQQWKTVYSSNFQDACVWGANGRNGQSDNTIIHGCSKKNASGSFASGGKSRKARPTGCQNCVVCEQIPKRTETLSQRADQEMLSVCVSTWKRWPRRWLRVRSAFHCRSSSLLFRNSSCTPTVDSSNDSPHHHHH